MSGVKNGKGVITELKNRINLCDKDNTKAGMEIVLDVEKQMKKEMLRQEVAGRSKIMEEKETVNPVDLARELRAEMEEEPVL